MRAGPLATIGAPVADQVNAVMRLSGQRVGLALVYHALGPREGGRLDPVQTREVSRFRRQLAYVNRRFQLVPAGSLRLEIGRRRRGARFPLSITFDDDLPSHVRYALPCLNERGIRATFFLCGASLQHAKSFWWERMQRAIARGRSVEDLAARLPDEVTPALGSGFRTLPRLLSVVQGLEPALREAFADALLDIAGADPEDAGLRSAQVRALVDGGHEIGFHTRAHHDLTTLNDDQLYRTLRDGRTELEALAERTIDLIAYPHGAVNARVVSAAEAAGFKAGFSVEPAAITPSSPPLALGRITPSVPSAAGVGLLTSRALARSVVRSALTNTPHRLGR